MKTHLAALLFTLCLSCSASAQFGSGEDNLVKNGNFSAISAENLPEYWKISHPNFLEKTEASLEILTEGETNFLRITKKAATAPNVGTQEIQIPPGATLLRLVMRMRGRNIARGSADWHLPGLGVTFTYPDGSSKPGMMSKWLQAPTGDSEWTQYESILEVRDGAPSAFITITGHGWTGTIDVTDIVVEAGQ